MLDNFIKLIEEHATIATIITMLLVAFITIIFSSSQKNNIKTQGGKFVGRDDNSTNIKKNV